MGRDPDKLSGAIGTTCPVGNPIFGFDKTPINLLATFIGLITCPAGAAGAPPGAMIATQLASPNQCVWNGATGNWLIQITLTGAGFDVVVLNTGPPLAAGFGGIGPADNIPNNLTCGIGVPGILTQGGHATISWGPDI